MNYISSLDNKFFKDICNLKNKRYRYLNRSYLIEGIRFVEEAIKNNCIIKYIIVDENKKHDIIEKLELNKLHKKVIIFSETLFSKVKQTENAQGVIACIEMKDNYKEFRFCEGIYFLIDKIQDPGNLGTIIRTAVAVNALGVIIVKGTVDLYNDKVLRATMGSIFKINIYFVDDYKFLYDLMDNNFKFIIADSNGGNIYFKENLKGRLVLAVGNEGNGLSDEIKEIPHTKVCIPMSNDLESLNVAQALSIIAFEYIRQNYI